MEESFLMDQSNYQSSRRTTGIGHNQSQFGLHNKSHINEDSGEIPQSPSQFIDSLCLSINLLIDALSIYACLNEHSLLEAVRNGLT